MKNLNFKKTIISKLNLQSIVGGDGPGTTGNDTVIAKAPPRCINDSNDWVNEQ